MKTFVGHIASYILLLVSVATAGTEVNNGAGLSEQNMVYAFANISDILQNCLTTDICNLQNQDRRIIKAAIAPPIAHSVQLLFANSQTLGQRLFLADSSSWTINSDLLWKDSSQTVSYGLSDAVLLILKIADRDRHEITPDIYLKLTEYFSLSVVENELPLPGLPALHVLFWGDRAHVLVATVSLTDSLGDLPTDLTDPLTRAETVCAADPGQTRILNPVVQGVSSDPSGVHIQLLFKVQSQCGGQVALSAESVSLLAPPHGPLVVLSVNNLDELK
jgi:hypothetical protein